MQRFLPVAIMLALLLVVQGQMWFGRGNLSSVAELQRKLDDQRRANVEAVRTNERLASEVQELREGLVMVEEKARSELGMVRENEIFVQVTPR